MKISSIAVLAVAVSSVNSAWINNRNINSAAVGSTSVNCTGHHSQRFHIQARDDGAATNTTAPKSTAGDSADDNAAADSEKEATEDQQIETAETSMDAMDSAIEAGLESYDEEDSEPLPPGKLCSRYRKPRCCETGGRLFKDGCERRMLSIPPPSSSYPSLTRTHINMHPSITIINAK